MKRLVAAFAIFSLVFITACAENSQDLQSSDGMRNNQVTENSAEVLLKEKPESIASIFEDFEKSFAVDSVQQNTAFSWKIGSRSQLFDGFRMKFDQVSISSGEINTHLLSKNFEQDNANTENTEQGWTRGYRNADIICLVQGMNGDPEKNTRDILLNCAETDQAI